jgi:Fe-S-cluster-containing dehydrogenase component
MTDTTKAPAAIGRRGFLKTLGTATAFLAALEADPEKVLASVVEKPQAEGFSLTVTDTDDLILQMQAELARALKKPKAARHWVMVIDTRKCVGCHACTIACVAENKLPPGIVYRPVLEEEYGTYPNVTRRFLPKPCMQCENPPCTPVCPVNATYKNDEGIIVINYEQCIGCRYCIVACPYSSRTFDSGQIYTQDSVNLVGAVVGTGKADDYERAANYEYGVAHGRTGHDDSPIGNVRKCHFCAHRLAVGMLPECVTTCIGRATYFGDSNDPDSIVAKLIVSPNVMRLKEDLGTKPRVFYLI